MVPTSGVTVHLILPHSLRCPADTYFTQVAMHYPNLQYSSGQTVAFGHYEDPLPDQMATKLPVHLQKVSYHCSGYRLLHWSPRLSAGSNKLPPDDVSNIIKVWLGRSAATKKAPSCSFSHHTTIRLTTSSTLWASLRTTFFLPYTNSTWS